MTTLMRSKQRGFTLLELLISMTVGMMLITGIIQLMANNKQHYLFQSELARMQENGRYALTVLRQELQMAGVSGCSANSQITNLLDDSLAGYSDTLFSLNQAVGGWEYSNSGAGTGPTEVYTSTSSLSSSSSLDQWHNGNAVSSDLDATLTGKVLKGTDVLVVKRTEPPLDLAYTSAQTILTTSTNFPISGFLDANDGSNDAGRLVVISDCSAADLFRNCSAVVGQVNRNTAGCPGTVPSNKASLSLGHVYRVLEGNEDATISAVSINSYYIGLGQDNAPTLYRKDYSNGAPLNAVPLVEGVESMQVLYGIDTDDDAVPNRYVTAQILNAIGTSGSAYADTVVSVRISLLLRSIEEVEEVVNTDSLLMAEATINSGSDRYLRKTVSTTVQLRNGGI